MEWFWAAIWAWFGWNVVAPAIGLVLILAVLFAFALFKIWRQSKCNHVNYFENRACHAICRKCGKDIGFIGTVRENRAAVK